MPLGPPPPNPWPKERKDLEPVVNLSILMTPGQTQQRQQVLWACAVAPVVSPDYPTLIVSFSLSSQLPSRPFLLLTKHWLPHVLGTAEVFCTWSLWRKAGPPGPGSTSSVRPCSFLVCAWGARDMVPHLHKALLPQKGGGAVRPRTASLHMEIKSKPKSRPLPSPAPRDARTREGQRSGGA